MKKITNNGQDRCQKKIHNPNVKIQITFANSLWNKTNKKNG